MTYRTYVSDPFSRMVSFALISFLGMVLVFSLIGLVGIWLIVPAYLSLMIVLSYFLMKFLSTGIVETELQHDRIFIRWIKPFKFKRSKDEEILLREIEDHSYVASRISKTYILLLRDGTEITYSQFNWYNGSNNDMERMGRDIWDALELYASKLSDSDIPLGYEKRTQHIAIDPNAQKKEIMQLLGGVVAVIAIYLFLGFPILKLIFPAESTLWAFKMLAAFTGILLLFAKAFGVIYEKWQKAKGKEDEPENESSY